MTPLEILLSRLDTLDDAPSLPDLIDIVERVDLDLDDVTPFVRFGEHQYQRNLIHAGTHYHAWVLCWKNGQRSPIHDHTGSCCAVRVLRGTLTETLFAFAPNGHIKAISSRDFPEGSVVGSQDSDMHQVSNLQAGSADLVTLHVYAPPLTSMGLYSLFDRWRGQDVWTPDFCDAAGI